jgi:integrase
MNDHTTISSSVERYLAFRQTLGYDVRRDGELLRNFRAFLAQRRHTGPLTTALALEWATKPERASRAYRVLRLGVARNFARYCAAFDAHTEIPPAGLLKHGPRPAPYIYSPDEIQTLLKTARSLRPRDGLRPHTYAGLLALIACTGIRTCEAVRLCVCDVLWRESALLIRNSKRITERLVPLHSSALDALREYGQRRSGYAADPAFPRFFIADNGGPLDRFTVGQTFRRLRVRAGVNAAKGPQPRIHDLRHTFATRRLLQWHREGVPLDRALLTLSAYLGHVRPTDTYWYLTAIPELMSACGERFERYMRRQLEGGQP